MTPDFNAENSKSLIEHGLRPSVSQVRPHGSSEDHQASHCPMKAMRTLVSPIPLLAAGWNISMSPPLTLDPGQQETVLLEGPPGTGTIVRIERAMSRS